MSNPARIGQLPGDLGLSFLPFLRAARSGEPPYTKAYPDLRHVATLIENKFHLVFAEAFSARDLEEVVRRRLPVRIGTGPPGSSEEFLLRQCLAYYGASYDDVKSWGGRVDLLGSGERGDAWRDNHLDIIVFSISPPAAVVTELLSARGGRFVSLPGPAQAALSAEWLLRPLSIVAGTYPGQEDPVETVGVSFVVFADTHVPPGIVAALTRAVAEGHEYLKSVHAGFLLWTPTEMVRNGGVPRHPEAESYYASRGWLEP